MKKLFLLLFAMLVVVSCSKENEPLPIPEIAVELPGGADASKPVEIALGENLTLKATGTNTEGATYLWKVNDEKVAETAEYTFSNTKAGSYKIEVTVTNAEQQGMSITCTVNVSGPYHSGVFVLNEGNMTTSGGSVVFIDAKGNVTTTPFEDANPGRTLGNVTQDMCFFDGKIYFISQNGSRTDNSDGYLSVVDGETMKSVANYTNTEFASLSWPTHLAVVSATKAYIRDNKGIQIADLAAHSITGTLKNSTGAAKLPMVQTAGKVFVAAGKKILAIDPAADAAGATAIDLTAYGTVSGMALGKDGNIWASCYGSGTAPSYMIKIVPASNMIAQANTVTGITLNGGWAGTIGFCASATEEALFFFLGTQVYKHTYTGEGKTDKLIDTKTAIPDGNMIYGSMGIHPVTGQLYVNTIKGYGNDYLINGINAVDTKTGALVTSYNNKTAFPSGVFFKTK